LKLQNGPETVDFTLSGVSIVPGAIPIGGGQFFYYGIISATVPVGGVSVTSTIPSDPNVTELQSELADFTANGGGLFLTYNGIHVFTGDATIGVSPSASFTLVAGAAPVAPEPATAILGMSGAVAFILAKLARQLRRKNCVEDDESSDS
jgi:hypothetical protein